MATPSPPSSKEFLPEPVTPHRPSRKVVVAATPTTRNENGVQQWGFGSKLANDRYERYSQEAERYILGPMPVEDFLDFLPEAPTKRPNARNAFIDVPERAEKEKDIYTPLIAALNAELNGRKRCPGFVFLDTSSRGTNHGKPGSVKPDVVCYSTEIVDSVDTNKTTDEPIGDLSFADLYIEVKGRPEQDCFTDPSPNSDRAAHKFVLNITGERKLEQARHDLGQNIAYAVDAFARQYRTRYFSVSLSGTLARLIRWDRGGVMVSESFDLRKRPEALCEFLWRYAHASGAKRGYDCTVECATKEEEALFEESITRHVKLQLDLEDMAQLVGKQKKAAEKELAAGVDEHFERGTVAAITVVDQNSRRRRLLVSRPVVSPLTLASRATRGYWAVAADEERGRVVFLKDTWRYTADGIRKEGDILAELQDAEVPQTPQLVHHGDVPEQCPISDGTDIEGKLREQTAFQCTFTPRYQDAKWVCKNGKAKIPVFAQVHYRLVLGTVGYGLQRFKGTRELLSGTYDAYQAMLGAFYMDDQTKSRLHRDISLSNIILVMDPMTRIRRGYLIDWELSCLINNTGGTRDYRRTGTFQFISQRMLRYENVAHTIQDDMESILWVVLYCSLLWLDHDLPVKKLVTTMSTIFDQCNSFEDGETTAGDGKVSNQVSRLYTSKIHFSNPKIQEWLNAVMNFNSSYVFNWPLNATFFKAWEDPRTLDRYWKAFLGDNELLTADRISRVLPLKQAPRNDPGRATPHPATRTMSTLPIHDFTMPRMSALQLGSIRSGVKRKAEGIPSDAGLPELKRSFVSGFSGFNAGPVTRGAAARAQAQSFAPNGLVARARARRMLSNVESSSSSMQRQHAGAASSSRRAGSTQTLERGAHFKQSFGAGGARTRK
ncbi:hypothetical protein BKA93DRAFT_824938 [Sparassis latifolia]|uniref:Fungal-type protein kinase domain-containing protein n=1 Tax=Sparassis crispa TaxID=139825 RepID=A0A401GRD6_9APHY|nr:predicted protein [Sparassis crispa]GBE84773.1 predicted protein [Sparassis crispa]